MKFLKKIKTLIIIITILLVLILSYFIILGNITKIDNINENDIKKVISDKDVRYTNLFEDDVVYTYFEDRNAYISVYNLNNKITTLSIERNQMDETLDIYENNIIYEEELGIYPFRGHQIMVIDKSSKSINQVTDKESYLLGDPAIYGNRIVWIDGRFDEIDHDENYNDSIYIYNLKQEKEEFVLTTDTEKRYPDIYKDKIVWSETKTNTYEIKFFDLSNKKIKNIGYGNIPQIWNDNIVYINKNSRLTSYSISSNNKYEIPNSENVESFDLHGNTVVWTVEDKKLFSYDFSTNTLTKILDLKDKDQNVKSPAIWDNKIVFICNKDGSNDIYFYELDNTIFGLQPLHWYTSLISMIIILIIILVLITKKIKKLEKIDKNKSYNDSERD
jgi:beta propeller repeat protein